MPMNRIEEIAYHIGYGVEYDLTAVSVAKVLHD